MSEAIPTDVRLTPDRSITLDAHGDIDTVTDEEYIVQSAVVDLFREGVPMRGTPITANDIAEFEAAIASRLSANAYFEPPIDVSTTQVAGDHISVSVSTADNRVVIEQPL